MPRARVVNLQQGQSKAIQILGLKELQANIKQAKDLMVSDAAALVTYDAAGKLYTAAYSKGRSQNVPKSALQDLFTYGRNAKGKGRAAQVTSLVGMRKAGRAFDAHGYRTWFPGRQTGAHPKDNRSRKKRGQLVMPGLTRSDGSGKKQKIGENLGTMWELGTTKMAARPWWRPAVVATRGEMLSTLAAGYSRIVESFKP